MNRRVFCRTFLGAAIAAAASMAQAQYPAKPIRLIVPLAAGGPSDSAARIVSQGLSRALGQPVIVENKPGADGALAAKSVLDAPADGYTLFWSSTNALIGVPLLNANPPYDPLDFTPISLVGRFTLLLYAHPAVPAKTLPELISYAREKPGSLNCATSTFADIVAAAELMNSTGIKLTRVPYKGAAQAIPDVLAGRVQVAIAPASAGLPHAREGRLRALAVFLPQRSAAAPDVPTVAEAGVSGVSVPWVAVFGPPKMPKEIVERLSRDINLVLHQPDTRAQLERQVFQVQGSTPPELSDYFREEFARSKLVVRQYGITQN